MNNSDQSQQTIPEPFTPTPKPRAPMEDLRWTLDQLDKAVARLSDCTPEQALEIPVNFDHVITLMETLDQSGVNLDSQTAQFKTISAQFRGRMKMFLRRMGGGRFLKQARQTHQPKLEHWWWYVDEIYASEGKAALLRRLRNLGIAAVILVVAGFIYQKFFAPAPEVRASLSHQQSAENFLILGNYENALLETEAALAYTPDSAELLILKGVLQDQLEQSEEADKTYAEAKELLDEEYQFYVIRARNYLMMENAELVLADCDLALELNPDSAVCYMQQGLAYELLGDISSATAKLELADETAGKLGNAQLQAVIRVNLSTILQKVPATTPPTPDVEN
jgi:tetratricopeptide (TPR) repeat protein